jgi:hypothetical protein
MTPVPPPDAAQPAAVEHFFGVSGRRPETVSRPLSEAVPGLATSLFQVDWAVAGRRAARRYRSANQAEY